jgi:hypothetical protein
MVNVNSKTQARKRVREAQIKANEPRIEQERHNVDDAASFLVEQDCLALLMSGSTTVHEVRAEAERRRHEHRQAGAAAVARMQARGESPCGDRGIGGDQSWGGARGAEGSELAARGAPGSTRCGDRPVGRRGDTSAARRSGYRRRGTAGTTRCDQRYEQECVSGGVGDAG